MKNLLPVLSLILCLNTAIGQTYILDNTFNGTGHNIAGNHNGNLNQFDIVNKTVLQPDGKLLLGGVTYDNLTTAPSHIIFSRFNQDGTPDNMFGSNGVIIVNPNSTNGQTVVDFEVLEDGKILGVGCSGNQPQNSICLFRLNPSGSLDDSFGTNGNIVFRVDNLMSDAISMHVHDNMIYIASVGLYLTGPNYCDSYISRYDMEGIIDSSFGTNGFIKLDYNNRSNYVTNMAFQSDDKIVLLGMYAQDLAEPMKKDFWLTRVNLNGTLDYTFGQNGNTITDFDDTYDNSYSLFISGDKQIYAGGTYMSGLSGCHYVAVARYNDNGQIDSVFATDGKFSSIAYQNFTAEDILVRNNKVLITGGVLKQVENAADFGILHLNIDGIVDDSNYPLGLYTTDIDGLSNSSKSILIQSDGKLILSGISYTNNDGFEFANTRYFINDITDITELVAKDVLIYPNPATDNVFIKSTKQVAAVSLYNSVGQLVYNQKINNQNFGLNSASYPRGMYLLKLEFSDDSQNTQKLLFE